MTPDDIRADAPERIWLQWDCYDVTWDRSELSNGDAEYIRADLHDAQIAALEARVKELERQVDDAWSEYYK